MYMHINLHCNDVDGNVPALAVVMDSTATRHCSSCWNLSQ